MFCWAGERDSFGIRLRPYDPHGPKSVTRVYRKGGESRKILAHFARRPAGRGRQRHDGRARARLRLRLRHLHRRNGARSDWTGSAVIRRDASRRGGGRTARVRSRRDRSRCCIHTCHPARHEPPERRGGDLDRREPQCRRVERAEVSRPRAAAIYRPRKPASYSTFIICANSRLPSGMASGRCARNRALSIITWMTCATRSISKLCGDFRLSSTAATAHPR